MSRIMQHMDIRTRPKQTKRFRGARVVPEPHASFSFYLPVAAMEQLRDAADQRRQSYSEAMTEALRFYLAAKVAMQHMNIEGRTDAAD
jgi:hypothetical protein